MNNKLKYGILIGSILTSTLCLFIYFWQYKEVQDFSSRLLSLEQYSDSNTGNDKGTRSNARSMLISIKGETAEAQLSLIRRTLKEDPAIGLRMAVDKLQQLANQKTSFSIKQKIIASNLISILNTRADKHNSMLARMTIAETTAKNSDLKAMADALRGSNP